MKSFLKNIITKKNKNLLNNLYKPIKKESKLNSAHFHTPTEPNILQQSDLLYLPDDHGNKFCLVVVDVYDRRIAAQPLKERTANAVLDGFKKLFESGELSLPQTMSFDGGSEFKGNVLKFFKDKGINIKISQPHRHKQQAFVETANKWIGSMVHKYQTNNELVTGQRSKDWVHILPTIVEVLNESIADKHKKTKEKEKKETKIDNDKIGVSGEKMLSSLNEFYNKIVNNEKVAKITKGVSHAEGVSKDLFSMGAKVRVKLERPIDAVTGKPLHGAFRSSDIKYELKPSVVERIILNPDQPPLYQVSGHEHAIYTKGELQPVTKQSETLDTSIVPPSSTYLVEEIMNKKTV